MNLEANMACGWLLGNLWPGAGRRERFLAVAAATISDVDGLSYLVGESAYANWHHTIGHNVFVVAPLLIIAATVARNGRLLSTALLVTLAFVSHILGDYFLSGWGIPLLWPLRRDEITFHPRMGLDHPLNIVLSYASCALMAGSLWLWNRSPLEFIWPIADALLARGVHRRRLCCDECGQKLPLRRAVLARGPRIICRNCADKHKLEPQKT